MQQSAQRSVLIVEDDRTFRTRFQQILTDAGTFRIVAAVDSVAAALAVLRDNPIDLLIADLGLPDGNGITVIREGAEHQRECAVMVVTVFGDEEHVVNAIEAGAAGYLLKDSSADEFLSAVYDLLSGGSPVSPMVARLVLNRLRSSRRAAADAPNVGACRSGFSPTLPVGLKSDLRFDDSEEDPSVELSEREAEILTLVAKGFSFSDICQLLAITSNTVKTHVNRIYRKLAVHSRGQAVYEATRLGLIDM